MLRAVHIAVCSFWLGLAATTAVAQSDAVLRAQERLENLGLSPGPADGVMGSRTRAAISEFQRRNNLPVTGELDPATQSALSGGLRQSPPPVPVRTPSAVPVPEVASTPLPPPVPAAAGSNQTASPDSVQVPNSTARPEIPAGVQQLTAASPTPAQTSTTTYFAIAALGFLGLWFLRRRYKAAANGGGRDQTAKEPLISSVRETRRPSRTEELRSRTNAVAERRGLSPSAGDTAELASAWRSQQTTEARPTSTRTAEAPRSAGSSRRGWIPAGENVVVASKNIGGMIYVGRPPATGKHGLPDNAYIDPTLSVASRADDLEGAGLHYWPSYSAIDARARATYLNWLASGRSDPRYNVGYVFLYFYGLERRYFLEQPDDTERRAILAEVERLLEIYGSNGAVRRYLGTFLEAARLVMSSGVSVSPVFQKTGYELPLTVRLAVGGLIANDEAIPADWMLSWLCTHPERWLRTPGQRAFPEFKALFEIRFNERFPDGLKVAKPRRTLRMSYTAASGNFTSTMSSASGDIPDISGLSKPLDTAWAIADEAMNDLDKFSRYLGRNPEGRGTIEAHALLPDPIKHLFPCPELEALKSWVSERISAGGLVPVVDLVERLEGARPDSIGKRQLTSAADALAALAIGMAPDPRFALRAPKFGEPVVLFRLPEGESHLEAVNAGYQTALLAMTLGTFIAHADGSVSDIERRHLEQRIEQASGLTASERARLQANLAWMMAVPPDLALFRRRLKDTGQDIRSELGRMALSVAGSDGHIDPSEIKAIQKLYSALGLEADSIYGELHALAASSDPVLVHQPSTSGTEYAIPSDPALAKTNAPTAGVELNHDRIAAIMSDTARVSGVLHSIFSDDEEPEDAQDEPEEATTEPADDGRLEGLDAKHRALVQELLLAGSWTEEEFSALAAQFGLMSSGALETINEWAYERFDDALLEDDGDLTVNQDVAAHLSA